MEEHAGDASQPPKRPPPEYRQFLVAAEQKCQDDFDKTVLSLSGGALGISFVFVKDIVGPSAIHHSGWLLISWVAWALSSLVVLASFFASHLALRGAIVQCDKGTIYNESPGGKFSSATRHLNAGGALLFFVGVCFMAAFVYTNLSNRELKNVGQEAAQPTAAPAAATPAGKTTR